MDFKDWPEVRAILKPTLLVIAEGIDVPLESFPIKIKYTKTNLRMLEKPVPLVLQSFLAESVVAPSEGFIVVVVPVNYMRPILKWVKAGAVDQKFDKPKKDRLGKPVHDGPDGFAITSRVIDGETFGYNTLLLRRRKM